MRGARSPPGLEVYWTKPKATSLALISFSRFTTLKVAVLEVNPKQLVEVVATTVLVVDKVALLMVGQTIGVVRP